MNRRGRSLEQGKARVLEGIARGAPLAESLRLIVELCDSLAGDGTSSILLIDPITGKLGDGIGPGLPAFYRDAIRDLAVGPDVGCCGAAAFLKRLVVTPDIRTSPNWIQFRDLALRAGLLACWSVPILSEGEAVLGTFATYYKEAGREPTQEAVEAQTALADLAGIAISRHRFLDTIRRSEASYRQLFDRNPTPMWIVDEENQSFLAVNAAALRQYGYSAEEFLQLKLADLQSHREPALQTPQVHVRKDGLRFLVEVSTDLIQFSQRPGLLQMLRDVSERNRQEARAVRSQRLESMALLAGGIAHNMNNILSPILLALDMFRLRVSDQESLDLLETLGVNARRASDLIRQVLALAQGVEMAREDLSVRELLVNLETILRDTFPKNIEVRVEADPELWNVAGDRTQLHQVLLNLCLNARDAMPEGGRIDVIAQNLPRTQEILIEVRDSGPGVPSELRERVFDPFFTTKQMGQGLGLSTSLAIMRSHGGALRLDSDGPGARLVLLLPANLTALPKPSREANADERPKRGKGELILVVDDEQALCKVAERTLQAYGYRVVLASDGVQGVEAYLQHRDEIKAVVTDIMMPIMDGPTMVSRLRELGCTLPVIATSGLATQRRHQDAAVFLAKPYSARELLDGLRQVLEA